MQNSGAMNVFGKILRRTLLVAAAVLSAVACGDSYSAIGLELRQNNAEPSPSNQWITVTATGDWTLTLDFPDRTETDFTPWAYFNGDDTLTVISGSGTRKDITFNWIANASSEQRSVTLIAASGSRKATAVFKQSGATPSASILPSTLKSDELGAWMELPATNTPGLYYFSHNMEIAGKTTRNYAFGWHPTALVALWVAYPLNAWSIGSGGRSNVWGLDPKLPRKYQPVLFSAFSSGNAGRLDRGHQIPSADRLYYDANVATFYGTNMTPQLNKLNAAAWGTLEGMVRNWARQFDTLYVTTGCVIDGSTEYCYDNDRKKVTVPTGYYKALLGYKRSGTLGQTGANGGYTAIGFWFDHRAYSASESVVMSQKMTIDDLEARTGHDFFVNLPSAIGTELAAKVESTIDPWWN